jgi:hypothetical protein
MRWLVCARLASGLGDFALPVTLAALVLRHGTATQLGLVLGAHIAGNLLAIWIRVRAPALIAATVQAVVIALYATHTLTVLTLAGLMLGRGLVSALFTRSTQGRHPLVGLVPAVAVVLGPLIGYLMIAGPGIIAALAFDAGMFVLAAVAARIRVTVPAVTPRLAAGWREIARRGWLLRLVLCLAAVNLLAAGPLLTLAPASHGVFAYALMLTAIGVGAVVGSVLCRYPRGDAMRWLVAAAVAPLVLALGGPLPLVLVAFLVVGAVQPIHDVLLIRALPREVRGPVSAVDEVMSLAVLPVGQVLGGLLIDRFGPAPTAWLIVCVLAAAPLPTLHRRRGTAGIRSGSPASAGSR